MAGFKDECEAEEEKCLEMRAARSVTGMVEDVVLEGIVEREEEDVVERGRSDEIEPTPKVGGGVGSGGRSVPEGRIMAALCMTSCPGPRQPRQHDSLLTSDIGG